MKEKLLYFIEKVKKINLLLIIFLAYGSKLFVFEPNFQSVAILAVLGAVYVAGRYFSLKEPEKAPNKLKIDVQHLKEDMNEIKSAVSKGKFTQISAEKQRRYFS